MPDFVHLHVHSHYSLLDGLGPTSPSLRQGFGRQARLRGAIGLLAATNRTP